MGVKMHFFHDPQTVAYDVFRCQMRTNTLADHWKSKQILGYRLADDNHINTLVQHEVTTNGHQDEFFS